jgi:hypothetical protein
MLILLPVNMVVKIDIIQWNSTIIFYHILLCFKYTGVYTLTRRRVAAETCSRNFKKIIFIYPASADIVFEKGLECHCTEWILYKRYGLFIYMHFILQAQI